MIKINNLDWYINNRKEQYDVVTNIIKNIANKKNFIIVHAKVKSGKKDMAIIYKLFQQKPDNSECIKTFFISALHRRADEVQRNELREYYGKDYVHSINNKSKLKKFIKKINEHINKNEKIDILLDELDYGSGSSQLLSTIWNFAKLYPDIITIIGFSATPEEALPSYVKTPDINERKCVIKFVPHKSYFGMKKFIESGRFKQSTEFFNISKDSIEISEQGDNLITDLLKDTKNKNNRIHIAVLRLSNRVSKKACGGGTEFELIKENKDEIEKLIKNEWNPKVKFKMIFISSKDEDKTIDWSSDSEWENYNPHIAYLFVVNEVAKRSTEWRCQPYLSWYHTHRPKGAKNTKDQDQERPVYYVLSFEKIGITADEIDFTIYGDKAMAEVSAELITITELEQYNRRGVKISGNTTARHINKQINSEPEWDYIPPDAKTKNKILETHPKFQETIKFKSRKKHPITKEKLPHVWKIPVAVLQKYSNLIGFRITNMRGDLSTWLIDVCIRGKTLKPPIKYRADINRDKNEGLNSTTKKRKNIYYEDGETNADNFKFCLRENKNTVMTNSVRNKSMYVK